LASGSGLIGHWDAHNTKVKTSAKVAVKAGETLDFVVDCRANDGYDSFAWAPLVRETGAWGPGPSSSWDARVGFHGPTPTGLSPWGAYAQVLLLTNEFAFVD
jgi:hypothetical protein